MIDEVGGALRRHGLAADRLHHELFVAPDVTAAPPPPAARDGQARVTVIRDGVSRTMALPFGGASLLDAGIAAGLDLPFSCKGGVCATCRAKVVTGEVAMALNYALEDWELAAGFVLACQSRPLTDRVTLDFDAS
jgi:ring-1,2-phenylacetyl-CoA epoxidase subunit PaaE